MVTVSMEKQNFVNPPKALTRTLIKLQRRHSKQLIVIFPVDYFKQTADFFFISHYFLYYSSF